MPEERIEKLFQQELSKALGQTVELPQALELTEEDTTLLERWRENE